MKDTVIQFRGTIYEKGYGMLAQKVMRNTDLPKNSRLIYAYICAFAAMNEEGERKAFPSIQLQCSELGMSEDTYYKWRKPLIEQGYLTIEKHKGEKGKFERNIYYIEAVPEAKKQMEPDQNTEGNPYPNNLGTVEPYPKNPRTVNPSTEDSGTNSNSTNSNSFKEEEENKQHQLENEYRDALKEFLKLKNLNQEDINNILDGLEKHNILEFSMRDIIKQYNRTVKNAKYDFSSYFVHGLKKIVDNKKYYEQHKRESQEQEQIKQARKQHRQDLYNYDWLAE
ncbi:helix-turn-helix domain-containing protein [Piscibacillus halophilus]|uniref:helix-turn-helix domain-containing protein n=1 Tax=Piscibacillus halophilus TaxID=571933 RepID=UPI00158D96B0|nr:helix-turn-helix domain-containing protein [Piscibacillus halophilus]